jgi:UDP-N-acetylmuramoyl-L-alanyl-D-glutamate--2,6-diaminopimelate ligase
MAREILSRLNALGVYPAGITADTRKLVAGDVFAAWPGYATDGRRYLSEAVARGASAVLWDNTDGYRAETLPVPAIGVPQLRELGGYLAHQIYGRPSESLWTAGVTGTNGKTTVSQWLASAMTELGERCGVIGTLGRGYPGAALTDAGNTTPDALELHRVLAGFVSDGAKAVAMEVSSIGLEQRRVNGVRLDVAIHTNLSRDHLDYHGTMDAYAAAKAMLFDMPHIGHAVINLDDSFGLAQARRVTALGVPLIGYTRVASNATAVAGARVLVADDLHASAAGLRFSVSWDGDRADVQVRMVASFNVSNLLAVMASLLTRGIALEDVVRVMPRLTPPEGRMQLVGGIAEPLVVIDYAHSPDALGKVLEAVRTTAATRGGRLVCVFGCGGDRDPGKRPLMGAVASEVADRCIITSDNPRSEDPEVIIEQIGQGAAVGVERIADRAQAIARAIGEADADDVIVVAGKGHEPYQEIQGRRLPFSDIEQARLALQAWHRVHGGAA